MKPHYNCPVQAAINAISGKWKVQIIWHLSFGKLGFAALSKKLTGVSDKVLTDQLRQLEIDGILTRKVHATTPPRVDYLLTPSGDRLIPLMQELCDWGSRQFSIEGTLHQPKRRSTRSTSKACMEDGN